VIDRVVISNLTVDIGEGRRRRRAERQDEDRRSPQDGHGTGQGVPESAPGASGRGESEGGDHPRAAAREDRGQPSQPRGRDRAAYVEVKLPDVGAARPLRRRAASTSSQLRSPAS
jgi:hypothetical protein